MSPQFAFIYIFNLIVGVGALALPIAFSQAGLIIGTILMVILCSLAYMTATYVIEAMSVANALQRHRKRVEQAVDLQKGDESVSEMYGVCVCVCVLVSVRDNWSVLGVRRFTAVCDVWHVVLSQISSNDEEEKSRLLPGEW